MAYVAALFSPAARKHQPPLPSNDASVTAMPSDPPAGGTGATAGGYDTSGHRDSWIDLINSERGVTGEIRAALIDAGAITADATGETATPDAALFSAARITHVPGLPIVDASVAALAAAAPAGGTGADAGGYDTSGHRDTAIDCVVNLIDIIGPVRTGLADLGIVGGVTGTPVDANFSPAAKAARPPLPVVEVSIEAIPTAAPAGGTGAQGGCYDTANNRDAAITSTNTLRTVIGELRTDLIASGLIVSA